MYDVTRSMASPNPISLVGDKSRQSDLVHRTIARVRGVGAFASLAFASPRHAVLALIVATVSA